MKLTRRRFVSAGLLTGLGCLPRSSIAHVFRARGVRVKIGATDWNLDQEVKPAAVELAKKIGFDGVEISLGVGDKALPLADPALQKVYLEESRKHRLPIASTCLNILHRNYLKNDPLGQRWVA